MTQPYENPIILAKKIYNMSLGEEVRFSYDSWILRVPGGWVVTFLTERNQSVTTASTFVPYNTEFKP